ncbi:hypothetical protein JT359_00070 [Candidatus Poribacteria bacterium]|nr:hypothetical protein [Candidatus Poribacteria bacterium]
MLKKILFSPYMLICFIGLFMAVTVLTLYERHQQSKHSEPIKVYKEPKGTIREDTSVNNINAENAGGVNVKVDKSKDLDDLDNPEPENGDTPTEAPVFTESLQSSTPAVPQVLTSRPQVKQSENATVDAKSDDGITEKDIQWMMSDIKSVTNGRPHFFTTSKDGIQQMIKSYEANVKDHPELQIIIDQMRKDAEGIVE